jgi:hypothetical protein
MCKILSQYRSLRFNIADTAGPRRSFSILTAVSRCPPSSVSVMQLAVSQKGKAIPVTGRSPHCIDGRLTVKCVILATSSSTYSPVSTSQEAHSVSIK